VTQLTIIYVIIFCAVLLAVQGAYWLISERQRERGAINRRLVLAKQGAGAQEILEILRRERGLVIEGERFRHINDLIVQTGLRLDQKFLSVIAFGVGIAFFVLFGFVFGYGFVAFVFSIICAIVALILFLLIVRRKRIARFSEQLPDAIDVIVRGVKSGYPFTIALGLVAKEMSDPIGTEFGMTSDEIGFGSELGQSLDHLFERVGHEDLLYLTMAIKVQTQTGGNLAEILSRLARLLRERAMLRLKVRSLSAEGRISAIFLTVMPFALIGIITLLRPDYFINKDVFEHPLTMPMLILCLALLGVGNFIMYRMVNFKA
jgi:tight adherence protein B